MKKLIDGSINIYAKGYYMSFIFGTIMLVFIWCFWATNDKAIKPESLLIYRSVLSLIPAYVIALGLIDFAKRKQPIIRVANGVLSFPGKADILLDDITGFGYVRHNKVVGMRVYVKDITAYPGLAFVKDKKGEYNYYFTRKGLAFSDVKELINTLDIGEKAISIEDILSKFRG